MRFVNRWMLASSVEVSQKKIIEAVGADIFGLLGARMFLRLHPQLFVLLLLRSHILVLQNAFRRVAVDIFKMVEACLLLAGRLSFVRFPLISASRNLL